MSMLHSKASLENHPPVKSKQTSSPKSSARASIEQGIQQDGRLKTASSMHLPAKRVDQDVGFLNGGSMYFRVSGFHPDAKIDNRIASLAPIS